MKKFNFLIAMLLCLITLSGYSQFRLNTVPPLAGGNGSGGTAFLVEVKAPIILDSLAQAFNGTGTHSPEVWYTPTDTTGPPNITVANGWTQIATAAQTTLTGVIAGTANPVLQTIPYEFGLALTPGVYRFYIGAAAGSNSVYTTWNAANQDVFSDNFITIKNGQNYGYGGPIPNPNFSPRQWNGGFIYSVLGGMNDAAALSVDSPAVYCSGAQSVVATIGNFGINQINSVTVNWSVNGALQTPANYTGLLDTIGGLNPFSAQVTLGTFSFPSGLNDVVVWTSMPNGMADTSTFNDTVSVVTGPSINGNFTLDAGMPSSATNFASFADLETALNTFGVCGPVTVTVAPGTYNETFNISNVVGLSAVNTLTIDGVDSALVTLTDSLTGSGAIIGLSGVSYTTIKNMTVLSTTTGTFDHFGVHLSSASNFDSIINLHVLVNPFNTGGAYPIGASSSTANNFGEGDNANFTTVMNCYLEGGDHSVHFEGGGTGSWNVGNKFIGNTCVNMDENGFLLDDQDSLEVIGNSISGGRSTFGDGITATDPMNFKMQGNYIHAVDLGMNLTDANSDRSPDRFAEISNNMVISDTDIGINLNDGLQVNVWHNSVYVEGTVGEAMRISGTITDSIDVRNNIFYSLTSAAFETAQPDSIFLKFNNNVYHTTGTNLLDIDGTFYTGLVSYQMVQPLFNANSLQGDPLFVSTIDLHVVGPFVNDMGDNSVPVAIDIDGDSRPITGSTVVDPGADEFNPPLCPPPSSLSSRDISSDSVTIAWMDTSTGVTYQYSVTPLGGAAGSGITGITSADTARIGGLMANTDYDFFVRKICGRADSSIWAQGTSFRTLCDPFTAPYYNGFETTATDFNDPCWSDYNSYNVNANVWVRAFGGTAAPYAGAQALYIFPSNGFTAGSDTLVAITPQFSDMPMGDKRVRFWANTDDITVALIVGTVPSLDPSAPFTAIDTFNFAAPDTYEEIISPITTANGYNGTDQYVVLAHSLPAVGTFDYIRIDEFNYEDIPTCPKPLNMAATNITSRSADLTWTGGGNTYEVEYGLAGFMQGSGTVTTTTTVPFSLTGLSSSTAYDVYVREICTVGDTSFRSFLSFSTVIEGPIGVTCVSGNPSVVFAEEFDAIGGWTGDIVNQNIAGQTNRVWNIHDATTSSGTLTGPFGAHSGANYIYYESSAGTPTVANAVSPAIDLSSVSDSAEMSFWMHAHGAEIGNFELGVGTSPTGPFSTVFSWSGPLQTAEADPYQNVGVRLDTFVGQIIYLQFSMTQGAGFYGDLAIDLLDITGCVSCAGPDQLATSGITPTSADFTWNQSGAVTDWQVEYGTAGFALGTGTRVNVTSAAYSATGLLANQEYDWYARAICGPGDTSIWVGSLFETPCAAFTAPYYNGFEGLTTDENDPCWNDYNSYSAAANVWVRAFVGVNGPSAGTQALYIFPSTGFTTGADTLIAVSPEFSDLSSGTKRVRFDANTDDVTVQLYVGTTDQADGTGNFNVLDTINFAIADQYANYTVEITTANGYNGTDDYVAFVHSLPAVGTFDYIRIDEFNYEDIPSCVRATQPTGMGTGATTADLSWTNGSTPATQWEIEYGLQGFAQGSGTSVIATSNPYTLTGLAAGTSYEYYIRAICGAGDSSIWEGVGAFFTDCNPITPVTLPFLEDWETGGSGVAQGIQGGAVIKCGADFQWSAIASDAQGRVSYGANAFNLNGTLGAVTLDRDPNGAFTTVDLILTLDLSAQTANTNLELDFEAMEHGEENHNNDSIWMRGSDTDPWVGFFDNFANITNTVAYDPYGPFDIDAILAAAGQTVSSTFQIRFGQEDNFPAPSDGFSFDNIRVRDALVGIEETLLTQSFSISPNPSKGLFTVQFETDKVETFNMSVKDVNGKEVYTETLNVNGKYNESLDFTSLAKGVYYLQLQNDTESKVEKLIIQ